MDKGWILGRRALIYSLVIAHLWGTLLVVAVLRGSQNSIIGDMFATVGFMIFSTLGVLVGGKAWKDFAPYVRGEKKEVQNDSVSRIAVEE